MKYFKSNEEVKGGFYFNEKEWDITVVNGEKGILDGKVGEQFVKLSPLTLLIIAPLLGAGFVIFLPAVGFAMLFEEIGRRAVMTYRSFRHPQLVKA